MLRIPTTQPAIAATLFLVFSATTLAIATGDLSGGGEGETNITANPTDPENSGNEPNEPPLGPLNVVLQDSVYRSGLDPKALAAAGVRPEQVMGLVSAVYSSCDTVEPVLEAADAGVAEGRRSVGRLTRQVRSGQALSEDVANLQTAKAACEAALAEREACLSAYNSAAGSALSEQQAAALQKIRANRQWKLQEPYLVVDRTNEEWLTLGDCIDVERITSDREEPMDQECGALLAEARSNVAVAQALTRSSANLAGVEAALNVALRSPQFAVPSDESPDTADSLAPEQE